MALQTFANLESLLSIRTKINANFTELYSNYTLKSANNLSELTNLVTARSNLGLVIGTNVQAWDADLDTLAAAGVNGTGAVVMTTNAVMVTPTIGAARATSVAFGSAASGLILYNVADEVTNFEVFKIYSSSSIYSLISGSGGSGTSRAIKIGANVNGSNLAAPDTRTDWTSNNINHTVRATSTVSVGYNFAIFANTASSGSFKAMNIIATINQSGTTDYTMLVVNPSETATGSGRKLLQDWQVGGSSKMVVTNAGWIGMLTQDPTHPVTLASTANAGIAIYNTSDQTTNFERLVLYWSSNNAILQLQGGGSSSSRSLTISAQTGTGGSATSLVMSRGGNGPFILWNLTTAISTATDVVLHRIFSTTTSTSQSTNKTTFVSIEPNVAQSGTAGFTGLLINPTLASTGSGISLLQDWQAGGTSLVVIDSTGKQGRLTTAPTHTDTHGSTSTGLALYNTVDQVTNTERLRMFWSSNVAYIQTGSGGSGTTRQLQIAVRNAGSDLLTGGVSIILNRATAPAVQVTSPNSPTHLSNGSQFQINFDNTISSGVSTGVEIKATLAQTGTAGYTALLINPTESTVGSGAKNLIVAQVGGVTKFSVDNNGVIKIGNTIAAAVAVVSTHKVTIDIGGTTYYLLATT